MAADRQTAPPALVERPHRRRRHVAGLALRAVVVVVAVGLAAIPFVVLIATAVGSSVDPTTALQSAVPLFPPRPVPSSQTDPVGNRPCTSRYYPGIVLAIHSADLDGGAVTLHVSICLKKAEARQLLSAHSLAGPPTLSVIGLESNLVVLLQPLAKATLANGPALTPVGSVTVPLDGYPRMYPLDRYAAGIQVSANNDACAFGGLSPTVRADPGVSGLDWSSATPSVISVPAETEVRGQAPVCNGGILQLALEAHRPTGTKLFVLCLIGIPLLLIGLLALRLTEGTPRSVDGLVGVTAIMLAILPIRTVLVPGSISALTLVDFALASEMALLATGAVIWFVWPRRGGRPG